MSFHRKDDGQPILNVPALPEMAKNFTAGRSLRPKLPSRGKVLCVFSQADHVVELEPAVAAKGFSLLRARPGIHAYWLAITGRPDVIITDVPFPGASTDSAYLMECLSRNSKTRDIPVIAVLDAKEQGEAVNSGLGHATCCVQHDVTAEYLLERVDKLVESFSQQMRSKFRRADTGHAHEVDAVFSELGGATAPEPAASPTPLTGPIQMPVSSPSAMSPS